MFKYPIILMAFAAMPFAASAEKSCESLGLLVGDHAGHFQNRMTGAERIADTNSFKVADALLGASSCRVHKFSETDVEFACMWSNMEQNRAKQLSRTIGECLDLQGQGWTEDATNTGMTWSGKVRTGDNALIPDISLQFDQSKKRMRMSIR